ncbi:hypothetical protein OF83DRAFT_778727 [Amylostereum chailletii]|nr:hypothetical protein OF83DRAFT_778727 [Amylostereum chailletii]
MRRYKDKLSCSTETLKTIKNVYINGREHRQVFSGSTRNQRTAKEFLGEHGIVLDTSARDLAGKWRVVWTSRWRTKAGRKCRILFQWYGNHGLILSWSL